MHRSQHQGRCATVVATIILLALLFYFIFDSISTSSPLHSNAKIIRWSPEMDAHPNDRRIFFHETSGRNRLNLRQTCAVESAAKHNPARHIQVFIQAKAIDYSAPFLAVLEHYSNITVVLLDKVENYFRGSALEDIYLLAPWSWSRFKVIHLSEYIRVLSLSKGGGFYMDLDFITLKPFDEKIFWNFVPMEDAEMSGLTNAAFHFQHDHRILPHMMQYLAETQYDPYLLKAGSNAWSNVVGQLCGIKVGQPELNQCPDIKLLPHTYLNPLPNWSSQRFLQNVTDDVLRSIKRSYAVHLWNSLSHDLPFRKETAPLLFSRLAITNCPLTFAKADEFV